MIKHKTIIIVATLFSTISCARLPCKNIKPQLDNKLVNKKLSAISKVLKRAVAAEEHLTKKQISYVCSELNNAAIGGSEMLQALKKEWGVSWKTIYKDTKCEYKDEGRTYMLGVFDMGLIYGMDPDVYYDILEYLDENDRAYLKEMFTEVLDYPVTRMRPYQYKYLKVSHRKMNLLERTCWFAYNSTMASAPNTSTRDHGIENAEDNAKIYKKFGFDARCKNKKYVDFADNKKWHPEILKT